jgi:hypothetical protein
MNQLQIKLSFEWETVLLRENVGYLFPMAVSPFMRSRYKGPAVFRWEVFQKIPGDKKLVYIGEAQEFCTRRLYSILNPGPAQIANKKINTEFNTYLKENLKIKLDICRVQDLTFGGTLLDDKAFADKHFRRLLVESMIIDHQKRGFTVADL